MAIWYVLHIVTDWTNCRCIGIPVVWSIMDWLTMLTAPVTSQVLLHLQFLWLTVLLPGSKWGDLHLSLPIWVVLCNVKDFLPKLVSLCVCEFDVQYWLDFCAGLPSISCYVLEGKLLVCLFKHTGTWAVGGNRGQSRKKKKKKIRNELKFTYHLGTCVILDFIHFSLKLARNLGQFVRKEVMTIAHHLNIDCTTQDLYCYIRHQGICLWHVSSPLWLDLLYLMGCQGASMLPGVRLSI